MPWLSSLWQTSSFAVGGFKGRKEKWKIVISNFIRHGVNVSVLTSSFALAYLCDYPGVMTSLDDRPFFVRPLPAQLSVSTLFCHFPCRCRFLIAQGEGNDIHIYAQVVYSVYHWQKNRPHYYFVTCTRFHTVPPTPVLVGHWRICGLYLLFQAASIGFL